MEKETDETGEKPARKKTWRSARFGAAAVAAMLLLVGSLTGQAELTAMNDELVAVSERISELKAEDATARPKTSRGSRRRGTSPWGGPRGEGPDRLNNGTPAHPASHRAPGPPRAPRTGPAVFLGRTFSTRLWHVFDPGAV